MCLCRYKFRIGITHFFHERRHKFMKEQIVVIQFLSVANCASNDSAQYVSPSFIARKHAIDNQE